MSQPTKQAAAVVYPVPSLRLPGRLRFNAKELRHQRRAMRCLDYARDEIDRCLPALIVQGSGLRRYRVLHKLDHRLSAHAVAFRRDDTAFKAAEAERKFLLEDAVYRRYASALWHALHSDSHAFLQMLLKVGADLDGLAGTLRTAPVGTTPDERGRRRVFPQAAEVAPGIDALWRFERAAGAFAPVVRAVVFHYAFLVLHPFGDANGRMARILFNVIVNEGVAQRSYIPCRHLFNASRFGYEIRLHQMDSEQDWNALITFFCDVILAAYALRKKVLRRRRKELSGATR